MNKFRVLFCGSYLRTAESRKLKVSFEVPEYTAEVDAGKRCTG